MTFTITIAKKLELIPTWDADFHIVIRHMTLSQAIQSHHYLEYDCQIILLLYSLTPPVPYNRSIFSATYITISCQGYPFQCPNFWPPI